MGIYLRDYLILDFFVSIFRIIPIREFSVTNDYENTYINFLELKKK